EVWAKGPSSTTSWTWRASGHRAVPGNGVRSAPGGPASTRPDYPRPGGHAGTGESQDGPCELLRPGRRRDTAPSPLQPAAHPVADRAAALWWTSAHSPAIPP